MHPSLVALTTSSLTLWNTRSCDGGGIGGGGTGGGGGCVGGGDGGGGGGVERGSGLGLARLGTMAHTISFLVEYIFFSFYSKIYQPFDMNDVFLLL